MRDVDPGEGSYIIPIILKQSGFIIDGILFVDILLMYMSERRHVKESISSVVFRTALPLRFRPGW